MIPWVLKVGQGNSLRGHPERAEWTKPREDVVMEARERIS